MDTNQPKGQPPRVLREKSSGGCTAGGVCARGFFCISSNFFSPFSLGLGPYSATILYIALHYICRVATYVCTPRWTHKYIHLIPATAVSTEPTIPTVRPVADGGGLWVPMRL